MWCRPCPSGGFNTDILACFDALGVTEVYRIGGAQGVASLAYGLAEIGLAPVDKIVGPGNLFVALAKRHVYGTVDIDSIAGPSEVVVIADGSAIPRYLASDLISQAEHSPGASILVTWEAGLIDQVSAALEDQLAKLGRGALARDSLERFGAFVLTRDEDEAISIANLIAPEHLHVSTAEPKRLLPRLYQCRCDLSGPFYPGGRGRLRRRPVARAADRRDGPMGVRALGKRLPQTIEPDFAFAQRAARPGAGHPVAGRSGGPYRPPAERRSPARRRRPTRIESMKNAADGSGDDPGAASPAGLHRPDGRS